MSKDYYKILEVDKNSTGDEIKKSFRNLSKKYHPDVNKSDDAEEKFKEIVEAYETLGDKSKRTDYDRFGSAEGGGFGGGGFDFSDIFGDIFGGGRQRQKVQRKGRDIRVKISLNIVDIIDGVKKKIKYNRQVVCKPCGGVGGSESETCRGCDGSGQRMSLQNTVFGQVKTMTDCSDCSGSGKVIKNKCTSCKGVGTTLQEEIVDIDIPAGVSNGMQLAMGGFGNEIGNGINGDLNILIDEERDIRFKREGGNIIIEKEISVIDAILGNDIDVTTPKSVISIKVNPGTEHGQFTKLVNKGIKDLNYGQGDMIIVFKLKIPKFVSDEEKEILNNLKESNNFKV